MQLKVLKGFSDCHQNFVGVVVCIFLVGFESKSLFKIVLRLNCQFIYVLYFLLKI